MKIKNSSLSSQLLVIILAALVLVVMLEAARAQDENMQMNSTRMAQTNAPTQSALGTQLIQTKAPKKSFGERFLDDTSLSYYHQFLGPTADGDTSRTYNIFQEAIDSPGTGQAPLQSFHAVNLRHQITTRWAVGATLAAANSYTGAVENERKTTDGFTNTNEPETIFFNARAYVSLPPINFSAGTLYTTLSYEAPTSVISRNDDMRWGWVAAQSFAFNLPSPVWSAGLMGQVYRMYFENNVKPGLVSPIALQTMIVSGGPYVNYRLTDKSQIGSVLSFDWDQRGAQSGTLEFNNNLPHRGRLSLSYFPQGSISYLQSIGVFAQALLKFRPETTALGADFSVRF